VPALIYRESAAEVANMPTLSGDVYMRIGHEGPRTLLKCRMRGIRLVRNRVSTITAALFETLPLKVGSGKPVPSVAGAGRDFQSVPFAGGLSSISVSPFSGFIGAGCGRWFWYTLMIVC